MSQMSVEDDRVEDGLAVAAVGDRTLSQDADALLAEMESSQQQPAEQIPLPAEEEPAGNEPAEGAHDETGKNDSSNGPSSGDDDDDGDGYTHTRDLAQLMEKGGLLMSGIPQSQESQTTDDGDDYMEEKVRKEFSTIKTSTWMQKKIDGLTGTRATSNTLEALSLHCHAIARR